MDIKKQHVWIWRTISVYILIICICTPAAKTREIRAHMSLAGHVFKTWFSICFHAWCAHFGLFLKIQWISAPAKLEFTASVLPDRKKLLFFSSEREEMFNPTPTVKGKSNAYLTISSVSQRDEIEILMHFRVFPSNGEADRHGDVIFTVWTPMV